MNGKISQRTQLIKYRKRIYGRKLSKYVENVCFLQFHQSRCPTASTTQSITQTNISAHNIPLHHPSLRTSIPTQLAIYIQSIHSFLIKGWDYSISVHFVLYTHQGLLRLELLMTIRKNITLGFVKGFKWREPSN